MKEGCFFGNLFAGAGTDSGYEPSASCYDPATGYGCQADCGRCP